MRRDRKCSAYLPEVIGLVVGVALEVGTVVLVEATDDAAASPMLTKSASLIPNGSPLLAQFVL